LHPKFKLNWLKGKRIKLAKNYLEELLGISSTESSPNIKEEHNDQDDFFYFNSQTKEKSNPYKKNCIVF